MEASQTLPQVELSELPVGHAGDLVEAVGSSQRSPVPSPLWHGVRGVEGGRDRNRRTVLVADSDTVGQHRDRVPILMKQHNRSGNLLPLMQGSSKRAYFPATGAVPAVTAQDQIRACVSDDFMLPLTGDAFGSLIPE